MKESIHTNALSRHADVYICDACGTEEALLKFMHNPLPMREWACFRPASLPSDFKTLPAETIWERVQERVQWDNALLTFIKALDAEKPVVLCGDLNAAYNDADLQGKGQGMHVPGYTAEERSGMAAILQNGFTDAYRHFHPDDKAGAFAYRKGIRGVGLDYFIVSDRFLHRIDDCRVHNRVKGSDHWPLELTIREPGM